MSPRLVGSIARVSPRLAASLAFRAYTTPARPSRRGPLEQRLLNEARAFQIPTRAGTLSVYRWPPAGGRRRPEGQRVLLLHDWESRAGRLAEWVDALTARGHEVFAHDAPAHGASAGRRATLADFIGSIAAVADVAGPFDTIIGHAFGGMAAAFAVGGKALVEHAVDRPRKLVLIASPNRATDRLRRFEERLEMDAPTRRRLGERLEQANGRPLERFCVADELHGCRLDLLVVHDTADPRVPPADAEAIASAVPGARVHPGNGLGRGAMDRDPRVIREVLRFVDQASPESVEQSAPARGRPEHVRAIA